MIKFNITDDNWIAFEISKYLITNEKTTKIDADSVKTRALPIKLLEILNIRTKVDIQNIHQVIELIGEPKTPEDIIVNQPGFTRF